MVRRILVYKSKFFECRDKKKSYLAVIYIYIFTRGSRESFLSNLLLLGQINGGGNLMIENMESSV